MSDYLAAPLWIDRVVSRDGNDQPLVLVHPIAPCLAQRPLGIADGIELRIAVADLVARPRGLMRRGNTLIREGEGERETEKRWVIPGR